MKEKINYTQVYVTNIEFKNDKFPKMKFKHLRSVFHTIRFWFRWNFNYKTWLPIIKEQQPNWIKIKRS